MSEEEEYPRFLYNRQEHEDSLYHHNTVVRMEHLVSPSRAQHRIRMSFDQQAAHDIFGRWTERALVDDVSLSGIADEDRRHAWVASRIQARVSPAFFHFASRRLH